MKNNPSTIYCLKQVNKHLGWFLLLTLTIIPCIILRTQSDAYLQVQASEEVQYAEVSEPSPTPTLTPSPTPTLAPVVEKSNPDRSEIEEEIRRVFGEEAEIAIAVAMAESHMNPSRAGIHKSGTAEIWGWASYKGECSIGLFQINLAENACDGRWVHYNKIPGSNMTEKIEWLKVPANNIQIAKQIYDSRGNFTAWSTYTRGSYKKFIK